MKLEYSSNNSGGSWWLTDDDWKKMEAAGWNVEWAADSASEIRSSFVDKDGRYLGALATSATIETDDIEKTVNEWERLTGQSAADEGCNCCGQPHNFAWTDDKGDRHWLEITKVTSWRV